MDPYHPQINGHCDRFNGMLINMLGTLTEKNKSQWKDYVSTLVYAYNCKKIIQWNVFPTFIHMVGNQNYA